MTRRFPIHILPVLLLVVWGLTLPGSLRADKPDTNDPQVQGQPQRQGRGGNHVRRLVRIIQLTEEQKPKLQQILQTHKEALENWRRQHEGEARAIREKIDQARQDNDAEALKAAREEFRALHDSRAELHKSLDAQLAEVLTDEQMGRARTYFKSLHPRPGRQGRRGPGQGGLKQLNLTEEQQEKVRAILQDAHDQANKADSPEVRRQLMQDAFVKIEGTVLTPEQIEKFKTLKEQAIARGGEAGRDGPRHRRGAGLNLTDEQNAQRKAIMDEARATARQAESREEKRAILREATAKVHQDVLTDPQREQLKQQMKQRMARQRHKRIAERLGLSEDQQARIQDILSSAREQARQVEDRQQRREIMKQARKKVHAEVLTDEQRKKLEQHRQRHRGRGNRNQADAREQT